VKKIYVYIITVLKGEGTENKVEAASEEIRARNFLKLIDRLLINLQIQAM
jgi:hypothetical protein